MASIGLGPVVFGTRVSHTIAVEILAFPRAGKDVLVIALLAALLTLGVSWWQRLPTSATVALAGGMVGAALFAGKGQLIHWAGVLKVAVGLLGSVVVGFLVAYVLSLLVWRLLQNISSEAARQISRLQIALLMLQGLAYGANDQEKAVGLMALWGMMLTRHPYQVTAIDILLPLAAWTAGLLVGGLRIAETVGGHVLRLRAMHSLAVELAAALTVLGAAFAGAPVSTTQTTDGSMFGLGAALAPRRVQWQTLRRMVGVWLWTMPLAVFFGVVGMAVLRL